MVRTAIKWANRLAYHRSMDMELVIALVLFFGMVACWVVLPGATPTVALVATETDEMVPTTLHQPA